MSFKLDAIVKLNLYFCIIDAFSSTIDFFRIFDEKNKLLLFF